MTSVDGLLLKDGSPMEPATPTEPQPEACGLPGRRHGAQTSWQRPQAGTPCTHFHRFLLRQWDLFLQDPGSIAPDYVSQAVKLSLRSILSHGLLHLLLLGTQVQSASASRVRRVTGSSRRRLIGSHSLYSRLQAGLSDSGISQRPVINAITLRP